MVGDVVGTRPYGRAPIVEAILDIHVDRSSTTSLTSVSDFANAVSESFPRRETIQEVSVEFSFADSELSTTPANSQVGLRLIGVSQEKILQIRADRFTLSHMPPYTNWDRFREEAIPLWEKYVGFVQPLSISRVALRYINRIEIPNKTFDLRELLNIYPQAPSGFGVPNGLMMQLKVPQPDVHPQAASIITLASEPPVSGPFGSMVLDIDVFSEVSINVGDTALWNLFERIRCKKNALFEASITDEIRRRIA